MVIKGESYIPQIDPPSLPATLPSPQAMESWGQNAHTYEPAIWGVEYAGYRYLERCPEDALQSRYLAILRNKRAYCHPARDVIPINSYLGSWFWLRKEHQTKLEFGYRNLPLPEHPQYKARVLTGSSLNESPVPNGTKRIFRYGQEVHLRDLVCKGRLRISPAQTYEDEVFNDARRDEEARKRSIRPGKFTKITTADGKPIPVLGDVTYTITGPAYHLVSFSCEWDDDLFDDFKEEACVVIDRPDEFARRVSAAAVKLFPGWLFHYNPVSYFDPYEQERNEYIDVAMGKDFRFAYQKEYRVLWSQLDKKPIQGYQSVEFGDARDIMRLFDRAGEQLNA